MDVKKNLNLEELVYENETTAVSELYHKISLKY
jgi:hypothetical protein